MYLLVMCVCIYKIAISSLLIWAKVNVYYLEQECNGERNEVLFELRCMKMMHIIDSRSALIYEEHKVLHQ